MTDKNTADSRTPGLPDPVRKIPRPDKGERSLMVDTAVLMILGAGAFLAAVSVDAFEILYEFSRVHEDKEIDEIVTAALVFLIGLVVFTIRRMSDRNREIVQRKAIEAELVSYQSDLQKRVDEATETLRATALETEQALVREREFTEMQRQFVSMASHEFRTPLAIIDGMAQRLLHTANDGRLNPVNAVKRANHIRKAVKRMTRLMESLLVSARIENGKLAVEISPCDVGGIVGEVCAHQQELATGHVISCDLSGLPRTIQADSGALEQVFTNLLSNAVKYAPDAPDIEVKAGVEEDQVVISVRDHGVGIDEDDLPKMFQRFFRAGTSIGIAGTGIGLSLVKALVEMHGGSVAVETKKGLGSVFTVRLPVAGPDLAATTEERAA